MAKKKKTKTPTREEIIKELCKDTLEKAQDLPNTDLDKLIKLLRHFFSKLFRISYNFNFEQLEETVNSKKLPQPIKNKIKDLSEKIHRLQYGKDKPDEETIKKTIADFSSIILGISKPQTKTTKKTDSSFVLIVKTILKIKKGIAFVVHFLKNLNKPGKRIPIQYISGIKKPNLSKSPERIYDFIIYTHKLVEEGNITQARKNYSHILKAYSTIPEKDKKNCYFHMKKLYSKINSSA